MADYKRRYYRKNRAFGWAPRSDPSSGEYGYDTGAHKLEMSFFAGSGSNRVQHSQTIPFIGWFSTNSNSSDTVSFTDVDVNLTHANNRYVRFADPYVLVVMNRNYDIRLHFNDTTADGHFFTLQSGHLFLRTDRKINRTNRPIGNRSFIVTNTAV